MGNLNEVGLIGLGVMGANLALNIGDNGYTVSVYNHKPGRTEDFMKNQENGKIFSGFYDIESFVNSLEKPRKIILMTIPGKAVDNMIHNLLPYLDEGDLIMDGGNTHFPDTTRRMNQLKDSKILYLGIGVSGGELGARHGPSIMVGGSREAYDLVEDMLTKISAKTEDGHCCSYMGDEGAGHFIKMIHNGIEYGMMQAIAEVYDIMRNVLKLSIEEIADIFETWNNGELNSYLMEISSHILRKKDESTGRPLLEVILDKAGQKGTGKWTAETALALGIPTPSLVTAVNSRQISFFKEGRTNLSKMIEKHYPNSEKLNKEGLIEDLEESLIFTNFIMFSQGSWLINEASKEYNFNIDLSNVFKIWKGGCIIRTKMLDFLIELVESDNSNINLLNSEKSLEFLMNKVESMKNVSIVAKDYFVPSFAVNTSLDYFFSMIEENHSANLIQAQRDYFGAHTYERVDKEGIFHTLWE